MRRARTRPPCMRHSALSVEPRRWMSSAPNAVPFLLSSTHANDRAPISSSSPIGERDRQDRRMRPDSATGPQRSSSVTALRRAGRASSSSPSPTRPRSSSTAGRPRGRCSHTPGKSASERRSISGSAAHRSTRRSRRREGPPPISPLSSAPASPPAQPDRSCAQVDSQTSSPRISRRTSAASVSRTSASPWQRRSSGPKTATSSRSPFSPTARRRRSSPSIAWPTAIRTTGSTRL